MERFKLARALAPAKPGFRVLDVGCGSGRFGVALALLGAGHALGLDFAPRMIDLARDAARQAGVDGKCAFEVADFLAHPLAEQFDLVLAMGYFDYIVDPVPHLTKMVAACSGHVLASFPKRWEWRVPVRRVRFALARGFVRFYSRGEVDALVAALNLPPERVYVLDFGRDYVLIVRPGATS